MRCMICDTEMALMRAVPDSTMAVAGFERRTFWCSGCHEVEQHLAFVHPGSDAEPLPVPSGYPQGAHEPHSSNDHPHALPTEDVPTPPSSPALPERTAPTRRFGQVIGKLFRR